MMMPRTVGRRDALVPVAILCGSFVLHAAAVHHAAGGGDDMMIRLSIVLAPLPVAAFCLVTARHYGNSKIFGRSFLVLGASYAAVFAGEVMFFHFVDAHGLAQFARAGETLFLCAYVLLAVHVTINVRYFAGRFTVRQKGMLASVPALVVLAYSAMFLHSVDHAPAGLFYYNLVFVGASSVVLALTLVAFSVFVGTAMTPVWRALLAGIAVGTVGDLAYNYAYTLGAYEFGDVSGPLWNASHVIVIYALYLHWRNI